MQHLVQDVGQVTIENNNINIYIVTLERRLTGTPFAILAMFLSQIPCESQHFSASVSVSYKSQHVLFLS